MNPMDAAVYAHWRKTKSLTAAAEEYEMSRYHAKKRCIRHARWLREQHEARVLHQRQTAACK